MHFSGIAYSVAQIFFWKFLQKFEAFHRIVEFPDTNNAYGCIRLCYNYLKIQSFPNFLVDI